MAPFPATRRVALAAALLASILLFFVALWVIFRGHIPHVSQRASVHQRELELTLAPLSETLTRMEGGAREFVDRMDPSRFLKTAAAPRPAPPPPARKGKGAHKAAPRPSPAPIPTPSFDGILPAAARGILVCDVNGNAVLASGVTSRIAAERDAKGFILDATGRSLVLAIPHQRAGQWLGSVYLYYDWANLLETSGFRGRFDPPGKKIALTPAGMAVCALDDEPPEPALLDRLDEHLKTYRTERGQYHLEDRGRSFQWATLSPFSVRVGVWYRDNRLGIPTVSLVLLLALLLFVAALFYLNYLVLTKEEEAGADGGDPEPLPMGEAPLSRDPQERFEASMEAHRASAAMEREFLGIPPAPLSAEAVEDPGDRARSAAREDLGERAEAALAELPDLPDLTEDAEKLGAAPEWPTLENLQEEIPSGVFAPRRREVPPSMEEDAPTLAPPEIPSEVFDSPPAADPKLSHLIDSVDSDLPAPVPRKVPKPAARAAAPRPKRVSAARMTLVQLAESIQKRKGIWSLKKQIAADLLNRYPRLREARIAVLIDNGEAHVPFQDHGLSSATRGRLSIPHGNKLWTSFLSRGKIVHIARHPEKSELLRRWFGPEDWKGVTQVAFIPVPSRQDGIFVTCLATGDDPTLPKKR